MIAVPITFQQRHPFPYPSDNISCFEEWFFDHYQQTTSEREYLAIFWTGYYVRADFGQDKVKMGLLQAWLDGLDRTKKYYTIIQYDNGILHDLSGLDIKVFSMSGGRTDYPVPLISMPHAFSFNFKRRPLLANFIGKLTHPIREQLLTRSYPGCYITNTRHSLKEYCRTIASSTFTLCPRGFGPTSFRIQEALQYGSIPVYISDELIIPHNQSFEEYGVIVRADEVGLLNDILNSIPIDEIKRKRENIFEIYNTYFTYEGNKQIIENEVYKCDHSISGLPI